MSKRTKSLYKKSGFTLIELLVVVGIFTLIIGVSFTLISTGRLSVFLGEAQIQAEESARTAMDRISKELRLANASKVHIYDSLGGTELSPPNPGLVVYFQIPVGSYGANLDLTAAYSLKWGDEDTETEFIYYYLAGPGANEGQLFRGSCSDKGLSDSDTEVPISSNISSLFFSQDATDSDFITIETTGEGESATEAATRSLSSTIKLRN